MEKHCHVETKCYQWSRLNRFRNIFFETFFSRNTQELIANVPGNAHSGRSIITTANFTRFALFFTKKWSSM